MRKKLAGICLTAAAAGSGLLPGCKTSPSPAPSGVQTTQVSESTNPRPDHFPTTAQAGAEVVARVNGQPITRAELEGPLVEAYGLSVLLNIVQLELAKQQVTRQGLKVTPQDVQQERLRTLSQMFTDAPKTDYDQLLDQFIRQQHISRSEFDLVIETNAYLRKFAEPQLAGKITDEMVRSGFSQLYGENRVIRDIELPNVREAQQARAHIQAGEPFEKVAAEMSHDRRTASLGGELPQFSAQAMNIPKVIKDTAFTLQPGQLSDTLVDGTTYHVIKLISIIPPKVVKFEDIKDSVRQTLEEQWMEFAVKEFRNQIAQVALQTMQIDEPILHEQWNRRLEQQRSSVHDRDSALQEVNRARQNAATEPATAPATTEPAGPASSTGPAAVLPPTTSSTRP